MSTKNIFWLAGENSGDLHASIVLQKIQQLHPDWQNLGVGGPLMQKYGFQPLFSFARFSVMGFVEVLKHLSFFLNVEHQIKEKFLSAPPDLVVLVDYPGLNMRIARLAKKLNIPVLYFISPQFWAWKYKRIFKLKKFTDRIAYILPFEQQYFEKHAVKASYVGHPIAEEITLKLDKSEFAAKYNLNTSKTWLGFLPGSRDNEIKKMLPVYLQTMTKFDPTKFEFLLSQATSVSAKLFDYLLQQTKVKPVIIPEDRYEMMKHADFMVATSGTATIETGYLGTPFLLAYKTSNLSYQLGKHFIKIGRIGLPNIILDEDLIPELIQSEVNCTNLAKQIGHFLENPAEYERLKTGLRRLHELLEKKTTSEEVSKIIMELVNE